MSTVTFPWVGERKYEIHALSDELRKLIPRPLVFLWKDRKKASAALRKRDIETLMKLSLNYPA